MKNIPLNEEDGSEMKGVGKMNFEMFGQAKKKVTPKDIQDNILKIQKTMKYIEDETEKTVEELKQVNKETELGRAKYDQLQMDLRGMNELYKALQEMEEKQYMILSKYKDSRFYIKPKDWLTIGGLTVLAVIVIALDRESPKITKLVSFILKLLPLHI